jgi:hypothetical protein
MDDDRIRQISAVLRRALKAFAADDYSVKLNCLTFIMVDILQDDECLSTREGYQRIVAVFAEAAADASAAPPILRRVTNAERAARRARLVAQLTIPDPRWLGTAIEAARQANGGGQP